jgi:hypothetical protein
LPVAQPHPQSRGGYLVPFPVAPLAAWLRAGELVHYARHRTLEGKASMAISKNWMEMTPKKKSCLFELKCYRCGGELEVYSDEMCRMRKCSSCKEIIDPNKCEVIRVH